MSLKKLRTQIDAADKKILEYLNIRAKLTSVISSLKRKEGRAIYSPDREREVLGKIISLNRGPLTPAALEAIYREIMSYSLSQNLPLKIAYLGPKATYTHMAALKKFGSQVEYIPSKNIADVFLAVEREGVDYGVVPVENSVEGMVNYTLDMFVDSDLKICAQIMLDVSHNLLACCPKNSIKYVYSNPQVFGQCRQWLRENLPAVEEIEVSSTTRAAEIAAKRSKSACIASLLAAKVYKLNVINQRIEDSPHNITKFLVIGESDAKKTGNDRTSVLFSIKDKVGALHDMLMPFKKYKINLTKIESRPSKRKAWDYYFFIDLEGHIEDPSVKKALGELERKCRFLKILGSYPVG